MACWTAWPGVALLYVMTVGSQPSALAASVKPGFSSEHAAAEQVRKATLRPFFGACGSGVVAGMVSWLGGRRGDFCLRRGQAARAARARGRLGRSPRRSRFAVVDDEELHADAATVTHAA